MLYFPSRFEEEQRELEKRRQRAIKDYLRKREASSGTSSLENSDPLPPSRESSCDIHTEIQSPSQSRRAPAVDLHNYQEGGTIGGTSREQQCAQRQKRDPAADLEKRVKDELFAEWEGSPNHSHNQQTAESDMTMLNRNFSSPPGVRGPRQVQDLSSKSAHVVYPSKLPAEGSIPMSPPPLQSSSTDAVRSPVPPSPTLPTATFRLQTSPSPPAQAQPTWGSHSLPPHVQPAPYHHHHPQQHQALSQQQHQQKVTTAQHIHHSDSNEWTDFTSAPYGVGPESSATLSATIPGSSPSRYTDGFPASYSTPALSGLTSSGAGGGGGQQLHAQPKTGTDVSEFDPIPVSTASGGVGVASEPHRSSFKQRT